MEVMIGELQVAAGGRESRASVVVHVRDRNDNTPEFLEKRYVVRVLEDLEPGEQVARIQVMVDSQ